MMLFTNFILRAQDDISISRDFVEINYVTYRKSDELKVVMQPVKMIRTLDPFKPKIEGCE